MRLILDDTLAPSRSYYRAFPREPSRSRALDLAIERIASIPDITLATLLRALADAADAREPVALIAARGDAFGFAMPIFPGTTGRRIPATRDALRRVLEADRGPRELDRVARDQFQIPPEPLADLLGHLHRVRGRFRRIEVRSAPLGADPHTLAAFRAFFGTPQLLAPTVGSFDVTVSPRILPDRRGFPRLLDAEAWRAAGLLSSTDGGFERSASRDPFEPYRADPDATRGRPPGRFSLDIWEAGLAPHPRFGSAASATDVEAVRAFVDRLVMPGSSYAVGPFPLSGLWAPGRSSMAAPFVLPGDPAYRELIASDPPTSIGRDTPGEWPEPTASAATPPSARARVLGPR